MAVGLMGSVAANSSRTLSWSDKTPQDVFEDVGQILLNCRCIVRPTDLWMPYGTYRWLVRGRVVDLLRRKRRNRPAFASALGRRGR